MAVFFLFKSNLIGKRRCTMAQNVVIDIDASTKNFERSLDELTAKVKSTAEQMDKAFSVSGNAEKSVKNTSNAVNELGLSLKNVSLIAAGNVLADGFEKAVGKIKKVGDEIYSTTKEMQGMQMALKGIVTSDLVKTGQVKDYTEATQKAEAETQKLLDWFKQLSLKSPYELTQVMAAFRTNANNGETVAVAKKTTEAILALGAGLGMGQAEMDRFSTALAQTAATGKMTQTDIRQFANNGFGMDKMRQIFDILSEKYQVVINDHNDFNKAIADGKFTTDAFFDAVHEFAMANYGGAVDAMASTIGGLISSMNDIKTNAINDLFLETSKTISSTLAPYVEYLMKLLTSGNFTEWGHKINEWVQKDISGFQKLGAQLENGNMMRAINNIQAFFSGKTLRTDAIKVLLQELGGEEFANTWIQRLGTIKEYIDRFLENKDVIIGALEGIGVAFAGAIAVNKVIDLGKAIASINPSILALTALGAVLGIAWKTNLFGIQEKFQEFKEKAHEVIGSVKDYFGSLRNVYEEKGMGGVWEKLRTDAGNALRDLPETISNAFSSIGAYIHEHGGEWIASIENGAYDVVGYVFGEDAEAKLKTFCETTIPEKIEEYKNAWETGGLAGIWKQFSDDANTALDDITTYITTHREDWKANAVDIIKTLFGETVAEDVSYFFDTLDGYFSQIEQALAPVRQIMTETFNETVVKVIESVQTKIGQLEEIFKRDTWQQFIENMGKLVGLLAVIILLVDDLAIGTIDAAVDSIGRTISDIVNIVQDGMDAINALVKLFEAAGSGNDELGKEATVELMDARDRLVDALVIGIRSLFTSVIQIVGGWVFDIQDWLAAYNLFGFTPETVQKNRASFDAMMEASDKYEQDSRKYGSLNVADAHAVHMLKGNNPDASLLDALITHQTSNGRGQFDDKMLDYYLEYYKDELTEQDKRDAEYYKMYGGLIKENRKDNTGIHVEYLKSADELRSAVSLLTDDYIKFYSGNLPSRLSVEWDMTKELDRQDENRKPNFNDFRMYTGYSIDENTEKEILDNLQSRYDQMREFYKIDWATVMYNPEKTAYEQIAEYNEWQRAAGNPELSQREVTAIANEYEYQKWLDEQRNFIAGGSEDYFEKWFAGVLQDAAPVGFDENIYKELWNKSVIEAGSEGSEDIISYMLKNIEDVFSREGFMADKYGYADLYNVVSNIEPEIENASNNLNEMAETTGEATETTKEAKEAVEETTGAVSEMEETAKSASSEIANGKQPVEIETDTKLAKEIYNGTVDVNEIGNNLVEATKSTITDVANTVTESSPEITNAVTDVTTGAAEAVSDSAAEAVSNVYKNGKELFYDEADGWVEEFGNALEKTVPESYPKFKRAIEDWNTEACEYFFDESEGIVQEFNGRLNQAVPRAREVSENIAEAIVEPLEQIELDGSYADASKAVTETLPEMLSNLSFENIEGLEETFSRLSGLVDKSDVWENMDYNGEAYRKQLALTIENSNLPEELVSLLTSIFTSDINAKLAADTAEQVVTSIQQSGALDKKAESTAVPKEEKKDWEFFEQFMRSEENRFYAQYDTAIRTQMIESGILTYEEMQKLSGAKAGSKDAEKWGDAYEKALNELLSAVREGKEVKGFQAFDSAGMRETFEPLLGQRLNDVFLQISTVMDGFSTITSENFADAVSFITDSETWQKFADNKLFNSDIDPLQTANEMFTLLEKLGANPDWVASFKTDTTEALAKLSPDAQLELIQGLIRSVDGTIDSLNSDNVKGLAAIEAEVAKLQNIGTTSETRGQVAMKDIVENWNNAKTPEEKKKHEIMLQSAINALYYDDNDDTYSGWLMNLGTINGLGKTPTAVDVLNQGVGGEAWTHLMEIAGNGLFSENIFRENFDQQWKLWQDIQANNEKQKAAMDGLIQGMVDEAGNPITKPESKSKGMLSILFGEDFDLSELGTQLFSGLAEAFNADTVGNLKELLGIEISEDTSKNWHKFATALSSLGQAFKLIGDSVGEGEGVLNMLRQVRSMAKLEISEDITNGWLNFANAMSVLGGALKNIMGAVGTTTNIIGDTSKIDPNAIAPEGASGILGPLKDLVNMKFDDTALKGWADLASSLPSVSSALAGIKKNVKILSGAEFSEGAISGTLVKGWGELAGNLETASGGLKGVSEYLSILKGEAFKDSSINEKLITNWESLANSVDSTSVALSGINTFKDILTGLAFGENTIPEAMINNWSNLAGSLNGVSNALMNINSNLTIFDFSKFQDVKVPEGLMQSWVYIAKEVSLVSTSLAGIDNNKKIFNFEEFADVELPKKFKESWTTLAELVVNTASSLASINEGTLSILDMTKFQDMEAPETFMSAWDTISGYLVSASTSLSSLSENMKLLNMSEFANMEVPEGFIGAWASLASSVQTVAENLKIIQPIFDALKGIFGGGEGEGGGLTIGGGSSTTYQFGGTGEGGEGGEGEGFGGLFSMLFGSMDAETLAIVAQMLTPELLNTFMSILTTQIDEQVIESWTMLSDQIERTSNAIIAMMVALTGGEEGELGDETAGDAFVNALMNIGAAAEVVGPQLQTSLNPPLETMQTHLELILANLSKICDIMKTTFPKAVEAMAPVAKQATGILQGLADAAASAAGKYGALAAEIWNCVAALKALAELTDGGGGSPKPAVGGGAPAVKPPTAVAGGTSHFRYGTAIVGEHGPELVTNNGSRAWQVFSNNTLMDEIARTRHSLNLLSNSAEYVAYNRIMGGASAESTGTTDNSQNFTNNFNGNIIGDDAFRDMVEDTVREVWRREMNLAN